MERFKLCLTKKILLPVTLVSLLLLLLVSGSVIADTTGPAFSGVYPADNAALSTGRLTVSLTATDQDNVDASSVVMTIDGSRVTPILEYGWIDEWTDDNTTLDIYYVGSFANGDHNVKVEVKDSLGNLSTKAWAFKVGQPLQITGLTPANGTVVNDRKPVISAVVKGGSNLSQTAVAMTLDGQKVPAYFDFVTGNISYVPAGDLSNETVHNAAVTAAEVGGTPVTVQWSFTVSTYSDMPFTVDDTACQKCHQRSNHPMNNCSKCHGVNSDAANPVYPLDDCYRCHFKSTKYPATYHTNGLPVADPPDHPVRLTDSCVDCHTRSWGSGVPSYHNVSNTGDRHLTTTTGCENCHAKSLTREHQRRKDSNGNQLTCYTCHNNPDSRIQTAIKSKNSACSACHDLGPTGGHPAHSDGLDANCQTCHSDSILTEPMFHQKNGCSVCHGATAPAIAKYSISTDNTSCFSCHSKGHNVNFVQLVPADIPQYPGFIWTVPQDAALWSQEPWFISDYNTVGAKIIISNRLKTGSGTDVYSWYEQNMSGKGWTMAAGPAQGSNNFTATYTKGNRMATIIFYGGESHDPASPFIGYRLEILYK